MDAMLVTGGAGFIGSNFVRYALNRYPDMQVVVLDALTYAGNLSNLEGCADSDRLRFIHGDIRDPSQVDEAMRGVETVVNFAAESHVDRSILDPSSFIETNYNGVGVLLEAARRLEVKRFLQVNTDEVYGHVPSGLSVESDPLAPRNPYAASKAAVANLTQTLAGALGPEIRVNAVAPGWMEGEWMERTLAENYDGLMARRARYTPLKRVATADDVAETMLGLIEGNKFVTGHIVVIDGGFTAVT